MADSAAVKTMRPRVVTILGAESTGKTVLARDLAQALQAESGLRCTWVGEWLRDWCNQAGRTPQAHEQEAIAHEQSRRIQAACQSHDVVVADTTALMTAVYSQLLFQDDGLLDMACTVQRRYDLTLLTANDLPWEADGLQRDGPHVREPVRTALVQALRDGGLDYAEVRGSGPARLRSALALVRQRLFPSY